MWLSGFQPMLTLGPMCWTWISINIFKTPNEGTDFKIMFFHPSSTFPENIQNQSQDAFKLFCQYVVVHFLAKTLYAVNFFSLQFVTRVHFTARAQLQNSHSIVFLQQVAVCWFGILPPVLLWCKKSISPQWSATSNYLRHQFILLQLKC